jgi:hypothetical protein
LFDLPEIALNAISGSGLPLIEWSIANPPTIG